MRQKFRQMRSISLQAVTVSGKWHPEGLRLPPWNADMLIHAIVIPVAEKKFRNMRYKNAAPHDPHDDGTAYSGWRKKLREMSCSFCTEDSAYIVPVLWQEVQKQMLCPRREYAPRYMVTPLLMKKSSGACHPSRVVVVGDSAPTKWPKAKKQ